MYPNNLNVCLCSLEIKWRDKKENLLKLERCLERVHPETDLLVLPETFSTGFPVGMTKEEIIDLAESNSSYTISLLKRFSEKYSFAIMGSFIAVEEGNLFNRGFVVEPSGECCFEDKAHLFRMGNEHETFFSGRKRMRIRFRGWNLAMVICYDLRFPVWCRNVENDYDALIVVANWPDVRKDVWTTLLKARSIENQAYVCGVNCIGKDLLDNLYSGSSYVFDFKGKDISVEGKNDGLVYATLNGGKLEKFRQKFPAWKDADRFKFIE